MYAWRDSAKNRRWTRTRGYTRVRIINSQTLSHSNQNSWRFFISFRVSNAIFVYVNESLQKKFVLISAFLFSESGVRPFKCQINSCTKTFTQKCALMMHLRAHSDGWFRFFLLVSSIFVFFGVLFTRNSIKNYFFTVMTRQCKIMIAFCQTTIKNKNIKLLQVNEN